MTEAQRIDPANDPRLTAYALGECDEVDRVEVEKILASDAAARAVMLGVIDEVRAAGAALSAGLARETGPGLTPEQRAAVLGSLPAVANRLATVVKPRSMDSNWKRPSRLAIAAGVVLAVSAGLIALLGYSTAREKAIERTVAVNSSVGGRSAGGASSATSPATKEETALSDSDSVVTGFRVTRAGVPDSAYEKERIAAATSSKPGDAAGRIAPGMDSPPEGKPSRESPVSSPTPKAGASGVYVGDGPPAAGPPPPAPPAVTPPGSFRFTTPPTTPSAPPGVVTGGPPGLREGNDSLPPGEFEARRKSKGAERPTGEDYDAWVEQPLTRVAQEPLSTFSLDVDTASYANLRRMLNEGHLPPAGAARIEEMLNYFPYSYAPPKDGAPFMVHLEVAACPWNLEHRLVRIGVKGREIERAARPASNIVFLIDVSGSMNEPNKLPLVKASLRMLLDELTERDHVAIAVYAGASGLVLPPTSCERKDVIQNAIDTLTPGGSTNGAAGIQLAYDTAIEAFIAGGTNRVVLCTDGDWNVGVTSHEDLVRLIEEKAKSGVFLTVLGFGMGNYKDAMLVKLADKGNGNYGYIDTTREAHKVLVEQASGTLVTIAKDVKVQVEFNPAKVAAYRLIGYEKRILAKEEFNDDTKDAGEIGAGHTVTALYEITPVGAAVEPPALPAVDPLKYQPSGGSAMGSDAPPPAASASAEMLTVKMRYKEPDGAVSKLLEFPLTDGGAKYENASADYKFQAAIAAFGMLLRHSRYIGTTSYEAVQELAGEGVGADVGGYRREFVELVARAKQLRR